MIYIPLIIGLSGLVLFFYGFLFTVENIKSKNWLKTKATITKSDLHQKENQDHRTKKWRTYVYECKIEYTFKSTGTNKQFTNNKITLRGSSQNSYNAKKICDYLVIGKIIDVYYNPKNPKKSYLVYQSIIPFFVMMFIGIFTCLFGLTMFFDLSHKNINYILNLIEVIE